jgi:hypothetical protein
MPCFLDVIVSWQSMWYDATPQKNHHSSQELHLKEQCLAE